MHDISDQSQNRKMGTQPIIELSKFKMFPAELWFKGIANKIAFQYDAYRPLVDRISLHALVRGGMPAWSQVGWVCLAGRGGGCLPGPKGGACLVQGGGVPAWSGGVPAWSCGVSQHALRQTLP